MTMYEASGCKPYTTKKCSYDVPSSVLFYGRPVGFTYHVLPVDVMHCSSLGVHIGTMIRQAKVSSAETVRG